MLEVVFELISRRLAYQTHLYFLLLKMAIVRVVKKVELDKHLYLVLFAPFLLEKDFHLEGQIVFDCLSRVFQSFEHQWTQQVSS